MKLEIGNINRNIKIVAGCGEYPKILASIGASNEGDSFEVELAKAKIAKEYGADIVIDHALLPQYNDMHKRLIESVDLPISTIAVYDRAADVLYESKPYFTEDDVLNGIEEKGKIGVDMITIHASALKTDLTYFKESNRIIPCTSRGGTMVFKNINATGQENFYFTYFDDILKIATQELLRIV